MSCEESPYRTVFYTFGVRVCLCVGGGNEPVENFAGRDIPSQNALEFVKARVFYKFA